MAAIEPVVIKLSDLVDGQEAVCFAALVKKTRGTTQANQPFIKCYFRDKRTTLEAPLWHDNRYFREADAWPDGAAYRLMVRGKFDLRYGLQLEILGIRPATDADARDGFDFFDLVESSKYPPGGSAQDDPLDHRSPDRRSLSQTPGPDDPGGESASLPKNAGRPELPPFLHVADFSSMSGV